MAFQFPKQTKSGTAAPTKGSRDHLEAQNRTARVNLCVMLVASVVNVLLLLISSSNTLFLFTAWMPYWFTAEAVLFDEQIKLILAIAFLVVLGLILLLWKKTRFASVAAGVLFVLDCVYMVAWFFEWGDVAMESSVILTALFHVWIALYVFMGIRTSFQLAKLPQQTEPAAPANQGPEF